MTQWYKVAVIGLDGATFEVMEPLLKAGVLPNLHRLMSQGAWGKLSSTLHPLSPPAWVSFMTGMNPGKHGIYDFVGLGSSGRFQIMNGGAIRAETVWMRLSRAGRRVAVVNVPMTYPPEPVNGFLIAGMDDPRWDRPSTHPPAFAEELCRRFKGYRVGIQPRGGMLISAERFKHRYVERLIEGVRLRGEVVCYLLDHYPLDFLAVVFTATDRIQHAMGHRIAEGVSPDDEIGQVYQACDRALGDILERMGDEWVVLVMSDHGACTYRKVFELSTWLVKQGWTRLRQDQLARWWDKASVIDSIWRRLARLAGLQVTTSPKLQWLLNQIVWEETRAFALGAFGSIYINLKGRFPWGIVEPGQEYESVCARLEKDLLSVRDPESGAPVVRAVHRASQVYHGPYVYLAPDLLVETFEDYFIRSNLDHMEGRIIYPAGHYQGRLLPHTGRHTSAGILIASGAPFASGRMESEARLIDLAPTILYLNSLPVPLEMDGRPLVEWLHPGYCQEHPVRWEHSRRAKKKGGGETVYSQQEAATVEDRLRDLGYIG